MIRAGQARKGVRVVRGQGERAVSIIAWAIGGFVLSVVVLFGIFGGILLSLLMVMATPFILGFLLVEAVFGKRPVYVISYKIEEETPAASLEMAPARRVSMQVLRAKGDCLLGYEFNLASMWTLNGELEGPAPLCPEAYRVLSEYAQAARSYEAEAREVTLICPNGHVVGLGLRPVEMESWPGDNPSPAVAWQQRSAD
ncbi:MAG: hypothetical protein HW388_1069 [Dehalococcoidia bacterium]|nr:hypothetical protein [Dehalococcoidia bacterium]